MGARQAHIMMNIVLTGFMGTGKTSVGRRLAMELGITFLDMDGLIEDDAGMSVKEIFAVKGEPYFRALEKALVKRLCSGLYGSAVVVATGGGAVADAENRALLRAWAKVVYLSAPVDAILKRIGDGDERPLLSVADKRAEVEKRLEQRGQAYKDADLSVDTGNIRVEEVVRTIRAALGV